MKLLAIALLVLTLTPVPQDLESKIKTFRNNKRFSVKYDKFKDRTIVDVGPFVVGGNMRYFASGSQMYMTARFLTPGPTVNGNVKSFALWFRATGKNWQFLKSRELYAIADGERFEFGEGRYDGDVSGSSRGIGVSETLGFIIPVDAFEKLGKAQNAELRIGDFEMKLKEEHKEAFRDLLALSTCVNCPRTTL